MTCKAPGTGPAATQTILRGPLEGTGDPWEGKSPVLPHRHRSKLQLSPMDIPSLSQRIPPGSQEQHRQCQFIPEV